MNRDWKNEVKTTLDDIIIEEKLPDHSLLVLPNYKRNGEGIVSYSVCINEPDFPSTKQKKDCQGKNSIVMNIKEDKKQLHLIISRKQFNNVPLLPNSTYKEIKNPNLGRDAIRISTSSNNDALIEYIRNAVMYSLKIYTSKATPFACCSSFIECSDAKKCVHVNKLYSKACIYRRHLDDGDIFYGKNKNC